MAARSVRGSAVEVDAVKRAELVETVVATGSVQTPFRVGIASQITGTVAEVRQADSTELFPLIIESSLFVYTALLATLTGLLAATAPALRAARLDPVVAIRG